MPAATRNSALRLNAVSHALLTRNRKVTIQQGWWWRLVVMTLVLATAGIMLTSFLWAWGNLQVVNLNYQLSQGQENQKQLLEMNRKLRIELANLTSIARLERLAVETYGMAPPQPGNVINLP